MGGPLAGDIVIVEFPFSDLSMSKRRPALVLAHAEFDDLILCQVTSRPYASKTAIQIDTSDFANGGLSRQSFARPDKLFTASQAVITGQAGSLRPAKSAAIRQAVAEQFR